MKESKKVKSIKRQIKAIWKALDSRRDKKIPKMKLNKRQQKQLEDVMSLCKSHPAEGITISGILNR